MFLSQQKSELRDLYLLKWFQGGSGLASVQTLKEKEIVQISKEEIAQFPNNMQKSQTQMWVPVFSIAGNK